MARPTSFKESDIIRAVNKINKNPRITINGTSLRDSVGSGRPDALFKLYTKMLDDGKITTIEEATEISEVVEVRELPVEVQQSLDEAVNSLKNVVMHCNDIAHNTVENRLSTAIDKAKAAEILAAEDVQKAQQDLCNAYDEIEQVKDENQDETDLLNEKITKLDRGNSELTVELNSIKKEFGDAQKENAELLEKLESYAAKMKEADIKIELLTQERNMAHTDKAEIKEQAALDKSELVDSHKAKVDSINAEHKQSIDALSKANTEAITEIGKAKDQTISTLQASVNDGKQLSEDIKEQLKSAIDEVKSLKSQMAKTEKDNKS